jgi:hypothetical protein
VSRSTSGAWQKTHASSMGKAGAEQTVQFIFVAGMQAVAKDQSV